MRPYVPRQRMWLGWRLLLALLLVFVAAFYGLMTAILPPQLLSIPTTPIVLLLLLCLWLLPDTGGLYDERFEIYMWWFLGIFMVWPSYVALSLPGVPWISPIRVVVGLLVITFLFNLATSSHARHEVWKSMNAVPVLNRLFWGFWLLTTLTIWMSPSLGPSLTKYVNNQIFWTMMFPLAALVGRREGMIQRSCTILVLSAIFVACIGINEYRLQKVIWIDYLPTWLQGDEEIIQQLQQLNARAGTTIYRSRGPQMASLYFAENLSIVFPLVVHYMYQTRGFFRSIVMLLAVIAMACAMYLTGARSGMVGVLLTLVIYVFMAAYKKRMQNPVSLGATATLMMYPALVALVTVLVLTWRRARVAVLGGGEHQASSLARDLQWKQGWAILSRNPFGHGVDRAAEVLGYRNLADKLTIDSYYLSVMLEFGVIALPILVAMFGLPMWYAIKSMKGVRDDETQLIIPLAIGLFNFTVIKYVLSSTSNFPLCFVMLGFVVALISRMQAQGKAEAAPGATADAARS